MIGAVFRDRAEAGRMLATRLEHLRGQDAVVLGLARGGVPVAAEIALALQLPLDVLVVKKIGVPGHEELAMGAVGEAGAEVVERRIVESVGIGDAQLERQRLRARKAVDARVERLREKYGRAPIEGRVAVLVDDGVATGSTMAAACGVVRASGAVTVIVAVPVAPRGWSARFAGIADSTIAFDEPNRFGSVGRFYLDFHQVDDDEMDRELERGRSSGMS